LIGTPTNKEVIMSSTGETASDTRPFHVDILDPARSAHVSLKLTAEE
jgi:hypothetical protein